MVMKLVTGVDIFSVDLISLFLKPYCGRFVTELETSVYYPTFMDERQVSDQRPKTPVKLCQLCHYRLSKQKRNSGKQKVNI